MKIIIEGITIELQKKPIRHLHLYVKPPAGDVLVTAPMQLSDEIITDFIKSKMNWIRKHQNRIATAKYTPEPLFKSGETVSVWGEDYSLIAERGVKDDVVFTPMGVLLTVSGHNTVEHRMILLREWYRQILREKVEERLPIWQERTGLACESWQIRNMKTRWGTCNVQTKKLWFSLQLAKKPEICLDYIILHELTHLYEPGHNRRFYGFIAEYMPKYQTVEKMLK